MTVCQAQSDILSSVGKKICNLQADKGVNVQMGFVCSVAKKERTLMHGKNMELFTRPP